MTVTEFAIIGLKSLSPDALESLRSALAIQDEWHAKKYPHLPSSFPGSICWQNMDDPNEILITARWDSVEAHWDWIKSEDNVKVMGTLSPHISQESNEDFALLHVPGDMFGESPVASKGETIPLLKSPEISVHRMVVDGANREEFTTAIDKLDKFFSTSAAPHMVRGVWREDPESEGKQEYVLIAGWENQQKHEEASNAAPPGAFTDIKRLGTSSIKHYKQLL